MRYPKLRELKEAIKSVFSKPYTTKYPYVSHTPPPKFRGKPEPNQEECIACGACAEVCPARAIEVVNTTTLRSYDATTSDTPTRTITWRYENCIFCGQCEALCTTEKGVRLGLEYDLAVLDRKTLFAEIKKELVVCSCCGTVIGTKPQLVYLAKKLGPLAYGNFPLTLVSQQELGLVKETNNPVCELNKQRSDLFRVLCPKCRYLAWSFDQTGK